jgi:hypothetical protein
MKKDLANFAPLGFEQVIFSKTDESETLGTALSIISEAGKSVSYITTGQNVPVDILVADPVNLAIKAVTAPVELSVQDGMDTSEMTTSSPSMTVSSGTKTSASLTVPSSSTVSAGATISSPPKANASASASGTASNSGTHNLDDMLTMSTVIDASKGVEADSSVKI